MPWSGWKLHSSTFTPGSLKPWRSTSRVPSCSKARTTFCTSTPSGSLGVALANLSQRSGQTCLK